MKLQASSLQLFFHELCEIFKNTLCYRTPSVTASAPSVAASVFFLKSFIKQLFCDLVMTYIVDVNKVEFVCLQICRKVSGFLNNFVRWYPIKLKIGMLDHVSNTFRSTILKISVDVPLILITICLFKLRRDRNQKIVES